MSAHLHVSPPIVGQTTSSCLLEGLTSRAMHGQPRLEVQSCRMSHIGAAYIKKHPRVAHVDENWLTLVRPLDPPQAIHP